MKTDSLWYKLFIAVPGTFFELIDQSPASAQEYQFKSIEVKEASFRIDGVFLPNAAATQLPIHFLEVQSQSDKDFYSRFFTEIFIYLRQNQPNHDWRATVLFLSRRIEPEEPAWYREFFSSGRLCRIYLDELEETETDSIGLKAIQLIVKPDAQAGQRAQQLISQTRQMLTNSIEQRDFVELIETLMVYKLPHKSREEIEAMLGLSDLKETKVYQEAKQEGIQEGIQETTTKIIPRLQHLGMSVEQIAAAVDMSIDQVQQLIQELSADSSS